MFSGVKSNFERHGFLRTIPYLFSRAMKRFMVFDIAHLMVAETSAAESLNVDLEVECRFLNSDEVRHFAQDPTNDISEDIAGRLDTGYDYCFAGLFDGELASYCWFALHSVESKHNRGSNWPLSGVALSYPDSSCFRYKGFTHPKYRGKRLYQHVAAEASVALQELGVSKILSTAEWVNYSALKSSYRSGYQYLGILGVVAFAGRRFVYRPKGLKQEGIFIDKDAEILDRALLSSEVAKVAPASMAEEVGSKEVPAVCAS